MPAAAILFSEEQIQSRVADLGRAIARDYAGRSPVLVTMLKGAVVFLADLFRAIEHFAGQGRLHVDLLLRV